MLNLVSAQTRSIIVDVKHVHVQVRHDRPFQECFFNGFNTDKALCHQRIWTCLRLCRVLMHSQMLLEFSAEVGSCSAERACCIAFLSSAQL